MPIYRYISKIIGTYPKLFFGKLSGSSIIVDQSGVNLNQAQEFNN
jgi:hypothetical protein